MMILLVVAHVVIVDANIVVGVIVSSSFDVVDVADVVGCC